MKTILNTLLLWLLTVSLAGCSFGRVSVVEPTNWQKNEFEKSVRNSIRKAVQAPGIDNGSTIIVTSQGDTLIAPVDSTMRAVPNRTVYVEIQSPEYPRGVSQHFVEMITITALVAAIFLIILIIMIMVFLTVIRRQGSRNKLISKAIDSNYPLPESFYTGQPKSAAIKVTQLFTKNKENQKENIAEPETPPAEEKIFENGFKESIKTLTPDSEGKIKQLRSSFIMIGLGIIIFISFASGGVPQVGFFIGGTIFVFGIAKLLTYYLTNRL